MTPQQLIAAAEELLNMPGYCESESLVVAKITLRDGRNAIIKIELTTDESEVADAVVWEPTL